MPELIYLATIIATCAALIVLLLLVLYSFTELTESKDERIQNSNCELHGESTTGQANDQHRDAPHRNTLSGQSQSNWRPGDNGNPRLSIRAAR